MKNICKKNLLLPLFLATLSAPTLSQVDPVQMVDAFETTNGKFEGYRRSGAKGVCAKAEFIGSEAARSLSRASVFSGQPIPVIARFSVGGANPKAADNTKSQRNMALQFDLPGSEVWHHGNISAPIFGAATPEQLLGRLQSLQPDPSTKSADPAKVKAFADANPVVLQQGKYYASQPVPASYSSIRYWGVHGFGFTSANDVKTWGKWVFEPVTGVQGLSDEEAKTKGPNFLFDDLRERVRAGNVAFNLVLEIAETGDVVNNATVPLPEGRRKVSLGTLKLTSVSPDGGGECLNITFDPNRVPNGIEGSSDPMLTARSATYGVSLGRRLGEGPKQ